MRCPVFLCRSVFAIQLLFTVGFVHGADAQQILYPMRDRATWVFVDRQGNVVTPEVECFELGEFSEGLIPFVEYRKDGPLPNGYMDASGRVIFKSTEWDKPGPFREGLAAVALRENGHWGYIDRQGQWAIPPPKNPSFALLALPFSEGLAGVYVLGWKDLGHAAFIDRTGKVITSEPFRRVNSFSEGFAAVQKGMWGFIDKGGRWIIAPQYHWCGDFREGLAPVGDRTQDWYVLAERLRDGSAQAAARPATTRATTGPSTRPAAAAFALPAGWSGYSFFEGLALVCDDQGRYGYIDRTGKVAIEPRFFEALRFSNGLAAVRTHRQGEWSFIDRSGKIVINRAFRTRGTAPTHGGGDRWDGRHNRALDASNPFPFIGGATVVLVHRGEYWRHALIDTTGKVLFEER